MSDEILVKNVVNGQVVYLLKTFEPEDDKYVLGDEEEPDQRLSMVGEPMAVYRKTVSRVWGKMPDGGQFVKLGPSGVSRITGLDVFPEAIDAYRRGVRGIGYALTLTVGGDVERHMRLADFLSGIDGELKKNWALAKLENFAPWEFRCSDCKKVHMQERFLMQLQIARTIAGIAFVIGSGWRCKIRNAAVGGLPDSSHLWGLAADIMALSSKERFIILEALLRAGFKRIGIHKYYIHVDADLSKPQGIVYLY